MTELKVGLFDNERETNLESTVAMVEDVLLELGHFINDARVVVPKTRTAWHIRKGSAEALIVLIDREDFLHLRATSTVMTIDDRVDQRALYQRLLELNHHQLEGAAFSLQDGRVCLVSERSTRDLDRSEVLALITKIQSYADAHDEQLVASYGGSLGGAVIE